VRISREWIDLRLSDLSVGKGSGKKPKRVGRGVGSGHGKTSGRGHKGQKARSGGGKGAGFEGGQMPLHRRLPKRGFKNPFKKEYSVINLKTINEVSLPLVTPQVLLEKGLIRKIKDGLKILGDGELRAPVTVKAHAFSASAKEKILRAGGSVEII